MNADGILDEQSLLAWLKNTASDPFFASEVAVRSMLRLLPKWSDPIRRIAKDTLLIHSLSLFRASLSMALLYRGESTGFYQGIRESWNSTRLSMEAGPLNAYPESAILIEVASRTYVALIFGLDASYDYEMDLSSLARVISISADHCGWQSIREDAKQITQGSDLGEVGLWRDDPPEWFVASEREMREILSRDPETWDFWLRWWDGVLSGKPLNWDLQKAVALEIPEEAWSDPKTVAAHIREIEARFLRKSGNDWLEDEVAKRPPPGKAQVGTTQAAMEQNREALPPTFDAIEGLLLLEIERLQRVNDVNDAVLRQLRIYVELYEAIRLLRSQLPEQGPVSEKAAEKSVSILTLYMTKFSELPRTKVNEIVEGVYSTGKGFVQLGLIGLTAKLGVSYGLPANACIAVGSMIFAPKNAAEIIKAAKEALPSLPKG